MKNPRQEHLAGLQRQYHQNHPWRLSQGGLFIPHCYTDKDPQGRSWWDDTGFILSGRRIIVWWMHPRMIYSDKIEDLAFLEAGEAPEDDWLMESATPNFKKVGHSRKKVVSHTCRQPSDASQAYYAHLRAIRERLTTEGIDFEVTPSWKMKRLNWAMGVTLIAPLEVRSQSELAKVAALARRLVQHQTTLDAEFPACRFGRESWLAEMDMPPSQR